MWIRSTTLVVVLCGMFYPLHAQIDRLCWTERSLTWEDFRGVVDTTQEVTAITVSGISCSYNTEDDIITVNIDNCFYLLDSWALEDAKQTPICLIHEQGHFDISEIFTRKLHRDIVEFQFSRLRFETELDSLFKSAVSDKSDYQELYDIETDHAEDGEKQLEWNEIISGRLEELGEFEGRIIEIPISSLK